MTTDVVAEYKVDVRDIEYLRHEDKPLLARVFMPRGAGRFPLVVEVHGGAWCRFDRLSDTILNERVASSGVVVVALDFRMPPHATYPGSMADINYAIRWLKQRAETFNTSAHTIGLLGISSGAHQAMLLAMRPRDPRYSALQVVGLSPAVDASVGCVIMGNPVIDPLGRYLHAKKVKAAGGHYPESIDRVLPNHDEYWLTEEAMAEGSPLRALERGEAVALPPVLCVQASGDVTHPRSDLERFVALYRGAGGRIDLQLYEGEREGFLTYYTASPDAARQAIGQIVSFIHSTLA